MIQAYIGTNTLGMLHYKQTKMALTSTVSHSKSHMHQEKPHTRRHSHVLMGWAELEPQQAAEQNQTCIYKTKSRNKGNQELKTNIFTSKEKQKRSTWDAVHKSVFVSNYLVTEPNFLLLQYFFSLSNVQLSVGMRIITLTRKH